MRTPVLLIAILFGLLLGSELNGQSMFGRELARFDHEDKPDSAYLLLDTYEKIYRENEQWDSLLYLHHQKGNLSVRYKTIKEVDDEIAKGDQIAQQYLNRLDPILINFIMFKAGSKSNSGYLVEAEKLYNEVIDRATEAQGEDSPIVIEAKVDLSFHYLRQNKLVESDELANSVYESVVESKDSSVLTQILQTLTMSNHWLGRYDKAIEYNSQNLEVVKKFFNDKHPNLSVMYDQMAGIYGDKGNSKMAIEYYNKAKDIDLYNYNRSGVGRYLSSTIGNLGNFYSKIGEHRLSMDYMTYSLDLNQKEYGEDSWTNMWHYSVLSTVARLYGDLDQADFYIDQAFQLIETNDQGSEFDVMFFSGRKAEMLFERDRYDEALAMALEVYNYFDDNPDMGTLNDRLHILNLISNIYVAQKDYKNADKWLQRNRDFHNENLESRNPIRIDVLNKYITYLTVRGADTEAYEVRDEIYKLRNNGSGDYILANVFPDHVMLEFAACWVEFLISRRNDNPSWQEEYFQFVDEFSDYYQLHLATVKTNSNLATNEQYLKRIFSPAIEYTYDSDPEKAILISEKCKSFGTRQILQNQLIDDPGLPVLEYNMVNSADIKEDSIPIDLFFTMTNSLDSVSLYKDSLLANDEITFQKYFGMPEQSLEAIRSVIDDDQLMVEFFRNDTVMYVFYIDQNSVKSSSFSYSEIDTLCIQILDQKDSEAGKLLREMLLPDEVIDPYQKLKILPDGVLNSISFDHLMYKDKALIYAKTISYGLSAGVLSYQKKLVQNRPNKNQFIGLTPGFTRELKLEMEEEYSKSDSSFYYLLQQPFLLALSESLSRAFSGEVFEGSEATELAFKSQSDGFKIVHIGTHGILDDDSPLFSKLIFAKDSIEDGYLHAYEVYGKNLNADLAVLSACSSGKEKTYASEGVVSLSHAFTHAGCPAVLMTKWDVDEKSTSVILEYFYENLKDGLTKSDALREAKLKFLSTAPEELKDPYYWAGLVLIGDDSPMFNSSSNFILILFGLILILVLGYFFTRKNKS